MYVYEYICIYIYKYYYVKRKQFEVIKDIYKSFLSFFLFSSMLRKKERYMYLHISYIIYLLLQIKFRFLYLNYRFD